MLLVRDGVSGLTPLPLASELHAMLCFSVPPPSSALLATTSGEVLDQRHTEDKGVYGLVHANKWEKNRVERGRVTSSPLIAFLAIQLLPGCRSLLLGTSTCPLEAEIRGRAPGN